MSKNPLVRVARVNLSTHPRGTSYWMQCDRKDIAIGNQVEVEMYAGTSRAYRDSGVVTEISHERYACSCHVLGLASEADGFDLPALSATDEGPSAQPATARRSPRTRRTEMQDIYDAACAVNGEDAYLSDGVWISPDGSLHDRGR